ncbi:MAG: hypothetical protein IJB82_02345 [Bacilli bacterium]|nr:hypothetical protein [Bacilli bacterium]
MEQVVIFIFERLAELIKSALSWKIYEDFSFLHFVLGFALLSTLFSFYKFGINSESGKLSYRISRFRNSENKKARKEYKKVP